MSLILAAVEELVCWVVQSAGGLALRWPEGTKPFFRLIITQMSFSAKYQRFITESVLTCMIWAACSGVPCRRSCSLTANTRSLLRSLPSLAARPPSNRSNTNTPDSSVLRTSLMPSCSAESRLCKVILSVAGLDGVPSGVEQGACGTAGVEVEEEGGAREAQRRSLSTVS